MMQNYKTSNKNMVFIIVLGISFFCLLILCVVKLLNISTVMTDIDRRKQELLANIEKYEQLRKLSLKEDEYRAIFEYIDALIPTHPAESDILDQINSISNETASSFVEIQFADRVVNNSINVMPLNISFSGDYGRLLDLIGAVSSGERLIRIDKILVTKNAGSKNPLRADIKARAFYR